MALNNHKVCSLGLGSKNLRAKVPFWLKACSVIRNLTRISFDHPDTFHHFRSYSAVLAEQQGHSLRACFVIHPLSLFSLSWNTIIALANLMQMVLITFRLCYILETPQTKLHSTDDGIFALHVAGLLDVLVNFNTGFQESFSSNIVLDRKRIACHYLGSWFIVDLLSSLPVSYTLLQSQVPCTRCLLIAHMLPIVKAARILCTLNNIVTFSKIFTRSYIWHRMIHHLLLTAITMHWANCVVYSSPVLSYYWNGQMAKGYHAFFLNSTEYGDLDQISISIRYQKALFLCLSSFCGTGISMYRVYSPDEYIVHSVIILYASMFMVYSTIFVLNIYMTAYKSKIRYHGLMNQVETFMWRKQFPTQLKRRVQIYYNYKYVNRYYKEDSILDCLSDQLRHEITLHTYHKFVNKITLFEGLPADVVGVIISHLQPEVYLANDLVVRAGDIGSCMYFIAYGTVAVYSLKGAEVCHLENGNHFGAVALMMKDNKRIATVVAIEISHLYRIDDVPFRKYIMTNPILRERLEVIGAKRMHETVVTDETFRRQQLRRQDQRGFGTPSDSLKS